jgi:hypothetical protein
MPAPAGSTGNSIYKIPVYIRHLKNKIENEEKKKASVK